MSVCAQPKSVEALQAEITRMQALLEPLQAEVTGPYDTSVTYANGVTRTTYRTAYTDMLAGQAAGQGGPWDAFETTAFLRAHTRSAGQAFVATKGHTAAGDGDWRLWRYDALDTTTLDEYPACVVGADGARWKPVGPMTTRTTADAGRLAVVVPVGSVVESDGFAAPGDGGGFRGVVEAATNVHYPLAGRIRPVGQRLSVKAYGAVGDGVADDTAALLAAFKASAALSMECHVPAGVYRITSPMVLTVAPRITGEGAWSVIEASDLGTGATILTISGAEVGASVSVPAASLPLAAGDTALPVEDIAAFAAGDMVIMRSTEIFSPLSGPFNKGEMGFISAVSGTSGAGTITLEAGRNDTYTEGAVVVRKADFLNSPEVRSITFRANGAPGRHKGLTIAYARKPYVEDVRFLDVEDTGVSLQACDSGEIARSDARNMSGTVSGTGYAFAADFFSNACRVVGCTGRAIACGFSIGGLYPTWGTIVEGNRFSNGTTARGLIQSHAGGANTTVTGNTVSDAALGIALFGPGCTVSDNTVSDCTTTGIYLIDEAPFSATVTDNKVRRCRTGIAVVENSGSARLPMAVISGNIITEGAGLQGISCTVNGAQIVNNIIQGGSPGILSQGADTLIQGNKIIDVRNTNQAFAIYLAGNGTGTRVIGNSVVERLLNETAYGIVVAATATDPLIKDNTVAGTSPANLVSAPIEARAVVTGNTLGAIRQGRTIHAGAGAAAGSAGYASATTDLDFTLNTRRLDKAATADFWDLTGVSTGAGEYRKVLLCVDASGNPSIVVGLAAAAQTIALVPEYTPWGACPVAVVHIPNNYAGGSIAGFTIDNLIGNAA